MVVVFETKTTLALGYTLFFREPVYNNRVFRRLSGDDKGQGSFGAGFTQNLLAHGA